ncbi:uncharacterized protein N7515_000888 [Penicillium bovifimosum]|uniref:chitinase n=1 Tax=Penicillium bovifimosum TaxID=126998 RepID=A0A9W9HFT9_9EURO|nr:uncharacterized protein N7515_000888 [Penicillium bovifimosum]KAJ5146324.1 hypothetical protein N7515_000888 [Penicillium bovifimosum]
MGLHIAPTTSVFQQAAQMELVNRSRSAILLAFQDGAILIGVRSTYAESEYCPLNVCCSEFGFCGTTSEFCGNTTVAEPVCGGSSTTKRTIGYYEGWNLERSCQTMKPESIPVGGYTHINFAFLYIDPKLYTITPMKADQQKLYSQVVDLKKRKKDLKVWISIGGWDFNDPGSTLNTFSELAADAAKQATFYKSLLSFMDSYGFDGVDLDWEYPVASERGGREADFNNFGTFLANMRQALDGAKKDYGLSITLPSSYWYLQHFDIVDLSKNVDWFNMMTYDLHGTWDADNSWIGSVVNSHTNLTDIKLAMDLLWRNDIDPEKVVMGLGFYGRSCPFLSGGNPGPCTKNAGTLSFSEIRSILDDDNKKAVKTYDTEAAVQIVTFGENQWVSYDDWKSFGAKVEYANSHCIGGTMVWAVSLDADGAATNGLTGATDLFPGDNGSQGGEGDVYIGPDLWTNDTAEVACNAPCTLVLPPYPLETPVTITWPDYQTSVLSTSDGTIHTRSTKFEVPKFTITEVPFWPETIANTAQVTVHFSPVQSIAPPALTFNLPSNEATFPLNTVDYTARMTPTQSNSMVTSSPSAVSTPAAIQSGVADNCVNFYKAADGDGCYDIASTHGITSDQFVEWNPAVGSDCSGLWKDEYYCVGVASTATASSSTTSNDTVIPITYSSSHPITIMPQPTVTSIRPKNTPIPHIKYHKGDPPSSGGCSAGKALSGCGTHNCNLFGCSGKCGIFGCDGGCGIGFCGGGCGLFGCGPGCGGGNCMIKGGGGGTGGGGEGPEDDQQSTSSTSCTETASMSTTTACDTACADAADTACATICDAVTVGGCTPTATAAVQIDALIGESWDWINDSEDEQNAQAMSFASFINPKLSSADPIMISGTTFSGSMSLTAAPSKSSSAATGIAATSCDLSSVTGSASADISTICSCEGGFGASLSTKTNAAKSTFLICAVDPPLTITTIEPTTTTKTAKVTYTQPADSDSTPLGFVIMNEQHETENALWTYLSVQTHSDFDEMFQISGSLMKSKVEEGSQAKFCGQTTTFSPTGNGDLLKGKSDTGAIFTCTMDNDQDPITLYPSNRPEKIVFSYLWKCWTNICEWEDTPVS